MIWDLWNLTCLGDDRAWPFAKRESHGGRPDWTRHAREPWFPGWAWLNGDCGVGNGWREWPAWLREARQS